MSDGIRPLLTLDGLEDAELCGPDGCGPLDPPGSDDGANADHSPLSGPTHPQEHS